MSAASSATSSRYSSWFCSSVVAVCKLSANSFRPLSRVESPVSFGVGTTPLPPAAALLAPVVRVLPDDLVGSGAAEEGLGELSPLLLSVPLLFEAEPPADTARFHTPTTSAAFSATAFSLQLLLSFFIDFPACVAASSSRLTSNLASRERTSSARPRSTASPSAAASAAFVTVLTSSDSSRSALEPMALKPVYPDRSRGSVAGKSRRRRRRSEECARLSAYSALDVATRRVQR
mmetsp:Transcript_3252/g.5936  ORF Transcript_3252/g.5936 Transcript_3252/m.5936 type:complete len:233 (+) Transcript_3252:500-1198(+)